MALTFLWESSSKLGEKINVLTITLNFIKHPGFIRYIPQELSGEVEEVNQN